jgi:hypothetical protein
MNSEIPDPRGSVPCTLGEGRRTTQLEGILLTAYRDSGFRFYGSFNKFKQEFYKAAYGGKTDIMFSALVAANKDLIVGPQTPKSYPPPKGFVNIWMDEMTPETHAPIVRKFATGGVMKFTGASKEPRDDRDIYTDIYKQKYACDQEGMLDRIDRILEGIKRKHERSADASAPVVNVNITNPCKEIPLEPRSAMSLQEYVAKYVMDVKDIRVASEPLSRTSKDDSDEHMMIVDPHVFQQVKGNTMNNIQIDTILNLANAGEDDEFSKYDALPEGLKKVLKRKQEEQEAERVERAAESVLALVNDSETVIKRRVDRIRALRKEIANEKATIHNLEKSRAYGMKTQNFVPLAAALGYSLPFSAIVASTIPDSFQFKKS